MMPAVKFSYISNYNLTYNSTYNSYGEANV